MRMKGKIELTFILVLLPSALSMFSIRVEKMTSA